MTGLAERIEIGRFTPETERGSEWAPYRSATQEDERRGRSRFGGFAILASLLVFSGITVAVAKGAGMAERYGISPESLLVTAWLIQGAVALFCFALAVRWLRS